MRHIPTDTCASPCLLHLLANLRPHQPLPPAPGPLPALSRLPVLPQPVFLLRLKQEGVFFICLIGIQGSCGDPKLPHIRCIIIWKPVCDIFLGFGSVSVGSSPPPQPRPRGTNVTPFVCSKGDRSRFSVLALPHPRLVDIPPGAQPKTDFQNLSQKRLFLFVCFLRDFLFTCAFCIRFLSRFSEYFFYLGGFHPELICEKTTKYLFREKCNPYIPSPMCSAVPQNFICVFVRICIPFMCI